MNFVFVFHLCFVMPHAAQTMKLGENEVAAELVRTVLFLDAVEAESVQQRFHEFIAEVRLVFESPVKWHVVLDSVLRFVAHHESSSASRNTLVRSRSNITKDSLLV